MNAPFAASSALRILLVKTSSMGDVVHALPVVHDLHAERPQAQIDWLVEAAYADIVRAHPGVRRVIPVELRRWRKDWWRADTRQAWRDFVAELQREEYDAVIDLQGLIKSAWLARRARGPLWGWGWGSAREALAAAFYRRRVPGGPIGSVASVLRNRQLVGDLLGYVPQGEPVYGLRLPPDAQPPIALPRRYTVLLTATARAEKRWAPAAWAQVAQSLAESGRQVLFAWGTAAERQAAEAIVDQVDARWQPQMQVQPAPWALAQWLPVLARAEVVVGVDTGLLFLAAALAAPCVGIYTATSPVHVGIHSISPHRNLGDIGQPPSAQQVTDAALAIARSPA